MVLLSTVLIIFLSSCVTSIDLDPFPDDILTPYKEPHKRQRRSHRFVRECQPVYYGNLTHEEFPSSRENNSPFIITKHFIKGIQSFEGDTKYASGHVTWLENPLKTFSILEPKGPGKGCLTQWFGARETVANSAKQRNCTVAINAGYFRTNTGACLGNVFSDGRFVQDSKGVQNANFGIKSDGTIVVGYLPEDLVHKPKNPFIQLVTGVFWILRNGNVYINESKKVECSETEETGTLDLFASVLSGRTALGHDAKGRIMFVQVDGKTHHRGLSLYDFATLLQEYGVVNAINLDGGGSTTYVIDGLTVNYPSDGCGKFNCARKVSTIACGHDPDCDPTNCHGNGQCIMGQCICDESWTGELCNQLLCLTRNCSGHGNCTEVGCDCLPGWKGALCSEVCPEGMFGKRCEFQCKCMNGGKCSKPSGHCTCSAGWTGPYCEQVCLPGTFGERCQYFCDCPNSCDCHPVTGQCTNTSTIALLENLTKYWSQCNNHNHQIVHQPITNYQQKNQSLAKDYSVLFVWFISAVSLCAVSLIANLVLLYLQCNVASTRRTLPRYRDASEAADRLLESNANEEL